MIYLIKRLLAEYNNLFGDIQKDYFSNNMCNSSNKIWINGLAKSGTSLYEHIVSELGYVDGARSILRSRYKCNRYEEGFICQELFDAFPLSKNTYIKTHALYKPEYKYLDLPTKIIVLRDIRDALVSRYFHIISDPKHWDFNRLNHIKNDLSRFKASVLAINPTYGISQFEYYARYVNSWIESPFNTSIFWYEDYISDPIREINKIILLLGCGSKDASDIENKLECKREKLSNMNGSLQSKRKSSIAQSGTFRSGKIGGHIDFFDSELAFMYQELSSKYKLEM